MPHETGLIATIAVGFALAFLLGMAAHRLKLPPLVGYLLAGVAVGPFTPGFVGDVGLAGQLAEIGVILLMFGVGLHFSIDDLLAVRRISLPGAVAQISAATVMGALMARFWGGRGARGWCSASPSPWRARWCCCGRWSSAGWWTARKAASPWAG